MTSPQGLSTNALTLFEKLLRQTPQMQDRCPTGAVSVESSSNFITSSDLRLCEYRVSW